MDYTNTPDNEAQTTKLVQLLTSYQLDIHFYIRSLVVNPDDVAEIVQNTNLVLWEKRDQFEAVQDFRAWAFQIARHKVSEHWAQHKRKSLSFSDALIDELAIQSPHHTMADNELMADLDRCIEILAAQDRELLQQRYSSPTSCENIAKAFGRPIRWVYNTLNRIRHELFDCLTQYANTRREQ